LANHGSIADLCGDLMKMGEFFFNGLSLGFSGEEEMLFLTIDEIMVKRNDADRGDDQSDK
jgi:hypothetical protein